MSNPFESDPLHKHEGDTDLSWDTPHHTLGGGPTQAAPGNHKHKKTDITSDGTGSGTPVDDWVNIIGDTMTGELLFDSSLGVGVNFKGPAFNKGIALRNNVDLGGPAGDPGLTVLSAGSIGRLTVNDPAYPYQVANKKYVDSRTQMQAGVANTGAGGSVIVTFPVPFNSVPVVVATVYGLPAFALCVGTPSTTAVQLQAYTHAGAISLNTYVSWIAMPQFGGAMAKPASEEEETEELG